jgi:hypothetical protein
MLLTAHMGIEICCFQCLRSILSKDKVLQIASRRFWLPKTYSFIFKFSSLQTDRQIVCVNGWFQSKTNRIEKH